jgi:hypothetical protein
VFRDNGVAFSNVDLALWPFFFRPRLPNSSAFLVSFTDVFQSTVDLERRRQNEFPILEPLPVN